MAKYVKGDNVTVLAFRGDTIARLADRIRFGGVDVSRYQRILLHVGTNDVAEAAAKKLSLMEMLRRFRTLRSMIRRRNSSAVLLMSAILPRLDNLAVFKPLIQGLNFALEKLCAKSGGACIYVPSGKSFLANGQPRAELFARDGLHLNGAGVDRLEACFQQALSTGFIEERLSNTRVLKLASIAY